MNTQEIITPVAKFIEWTFETILVPMSSPFNMAVIALGFGGLFLWLRLQKNTRPRPRKKAASSNSLPLLLHAKSKTSAPMSVRW